MNIPKKEIISFPRDIEDLEFFGGRLIYKTLEEIDTLDPGELGEFDELETEKQEEIIRDIIPSLKNAETYKEISNTMTYWCQELITEKLLRMNVIKETFGLDIDEVEYNYKNDYSFYDETFILIAEIIDVEQFKKGFEKHKYDVEMFFESEQKNLSSRFDRFPKNYKTFCDGIDDEIYGEVLPYEHWGEVLKFIISSNKKFLQDGPEYINIEDTFPRVVELDIRRAFDDYEGVLYQYQEEIFMFLISDIISDLKREYVKQNVKEEEKK